MYDKYVKTHVFSRWDCKSDVKFRIDVENDFIVARFPFICRERFLSGASPRRQPAPMASDFLIFATIFAHGSGEGLGWDSRRILTLLGHLSSSILSPFGAPLDVRTALEIYFGDLWSAFWVPLGVQRALETYFL